MVQFTTEILQQVLDHVSFSDLRHLPTLSNGPHPFIINSLEYGDRLFVEACSRGESDKVEEILCDGIRNPEYDGNVAIRWASASARGHEGVVKLLLQDGRPDPKARDNWAIR
jgi:hypothetical protein